MLLKLKNKLTYGPVQSRRLGPSLGINILPFNTKLCTFNCLYCQYGWTDSKKINLAAFTSLAAVSEIAVELEEIFQQISHPPGYITFSGNGEPTLHPGFPEIVDHVIHLRDKYLPFAKTAILSNSSMINDASVKIALAKLDVRIMKLDAGNQKTFSRFNQPVNGIGFKEIADGLAHLGKVTIQTLFASGPLGNCDAVSVSDWVKVIKNIAPIDVQLYSLHRDSPSSDISEVNRCLLNSIGSRLLTENINFKIF